MFRKRTAVQLAYHLRIPCEPLRRFRLLLAIFTAATLYQLRMPECERLAIALLQARPEDVATGSIS